MNRKLSTILNIKGIVKAIILLVFFKNLNLLYSNEVKQLRKCFRIPLYVQCS